MPQRSGFITSLHGSDDAATQCYLLTRSATLTAEGCKARRRHPIVWLEKLTSEKALFGRRFAIRELRPQLALRLYEKFTPGVEELESLLNRDLSTWKSPGFARRLEMGEIA